MTKTKTWAVTSCSRLLVARLHPGSDVITEIKHICEVEQVKAACVTSLIGSLSQASYVYTVPFSLSKFGLAYTDPITLPGPLELLSGQGTIGTGKDGNISVHLHASMCDSDRLVYGGHLCDLGNTVAATVEVFVLEASAMDLVRIPDHESGFSFFTPMPG